VNASDCKYDAFKVQQGEVQHGQALTITKDANGANKNTFTWTITKDVDKTIVKQIGGSATFNYTVSVTHDGGTISDVKVIGTISVFNPNVDSNNNTVPVDIDGVTDQLSDGTVCTVTNGGPQTLTAAKTTFAYECDLVALPQGQLDNTASVSWSQQFLNNGALLDAGSPSFTFSNISFAETKVDNCTTVKDTFNGGSAATLGMVCAGNSPAASNLNSSLLANFSESYDPTARTFTFKYSRPIPVPQFGCQSYDNTATFTTNDTSATGSANKTVTVCGPVKTGALTMGFWQNKNGQGIISAANQANLGTWLSGYHPFSNAPSTGLAAYVSNIIKAATCTSTSKACNSMLRAQMLATALDVYFSDPALGGNKIGAYNGLGTSQQPIGGVMIDLTMICQMIDGSGSTATCSGTFENVSSAFGGATSMTVLNMLLYQNTADPLADAGANWYNQGKATQVLAKDAFDAINNQVVFAP
jgi:ribosomal protein S16